jgi:tetratricopeptide (TPR) repeat protein
LETEHLIEQANQLRFSQRYREAEAMFRTAFARALRDHQGSNIAQCAYSLAATLFEMEQHVAAEEFLNTALKVPGLDGESAAALKVQLAQVYHRTGRLAQAETAYMEAVRQAGPNSVWLTAAYSHLSALRFTQGRPAEAEILQRRALAESRRTFGPAHIQTAQVLLNLASLYSNMNRREMAESTIKEAIAIIDNFPTPASVIKLRATELLGSILMKANRLAEAKESFASALEQSKQVLGPEHPQVAFFENALGSVLCNTGHCVAGRRYIESA